MSRRRFTEALVIETLYLRGVEVTCFRCGQPLRPTQKIEREHIVEIALGGADEPSNCAYSHKDCHHVVTNGSPSTTAGSSKNRIAKSRGTRAEKFEVQKPTLDADRVGQPSGRCRYCGQDPCTCPPRQKRSAFQMARR